MTILKMSHLGASRNAPLHTCVRTVTYVPDLSPGTVDHTVWAAVKSGDLRPNPVSLEFSVTLLASESLARENKDEQHLLKTSHFLIPSTRSDGFCSCFDNFLSYFPSHVPFRTWSFLPHLMGPLDSGLIPVLLVTAEEEAACVLRMRWIFRS